jgi:hypothetical protein
MNGVATQVLINIKNLKQIREKERSGKPEVEAPVVERDYFSEQRSTYKESRKFFKDVTYLPKKREKTKANTDIIIEAVYGSKWQSKVTRTGHHTPNGASDDSSEDQDYVPGIQSSRVIGLQ